MRVISLIQQKGGVGKTTISVHLAHELKAMEPNKRVVVADADPQASATKWVQRGRANGYNGVDVVAVATDGTGKGLREELLRTKADIVVLDLPPSIEAVSLRGALYADLMLVPVGASALDLESADKALEVCEEAIQLDAKKSFLLVPSKVDRRTSAGRELRDALGKRGPIAGTSIHLRVDYADAATMGCGVGEYAPDSDAHKEMRMLATETLKALGGQ
ncbi:MAG: ParA family protein [Gammaproteobacteria bacterium]|jgi:chromosome partitioning protein